MALFSDRSLRPALTASLVTAAALCSAVACGSDAPPLPTVACSLIPDLSTSATPVTGRASQQLTDFVVRQGCSSVQVVPITANSSGEACTVPAVNLLDLTAAPDNPEGRRVEIEDEKVPEILAQITALHRCVDEHGTGNGTDVAGAFRQADKLANGEPMVVLVVSDLVHNVGLTMLDTPLETDEQRAALAGTLAQQLPDLTGWEITAAGAAAGTTDLTPTQSDAIQVVWEQAVRSRGGSWYRVSL